uniref:Uncharacterized protein n=1 Tax=Pararge aegeria TaxID=116150 RepID=S4P600_9NEOP
MRYTNYLFYHNEDLKMSTDGNFCFHIFCINWMSSVSCDNDYYGSSLNCQKHDMEIRCLDENMKIYYID